MDAGLPLLRPADLESTSLRASAVSPALRGYGNRQSNAGVDGPPQLEIGESQVQTAAATDTCSGLNALLLQSLFAGASGRDGLAPAGRPTGKRFEGSDSRLLAM